jgi:hypothetical protein
MVPPPKSATKASPESFMIWEISLMVNVAVIGVDPL